MQIAHCTAFVIFKNKNYITKKRRPKFNALCKTNSVPACGITNRSIQKYLVTKQNPLYTDLVLQFKLQIVRFLQQRNIMAGLLM